MGANTKNEKGEHVTSEPDVMRIKREKRERRVEPAPAGLTRRRFLTFLGAGSAALAAGSAGVFDTGQEDEATFELVRSCALAYRGSWHANLLKVRLP